MKVDTERGEKKSAFEDELAKLQEAVSRLESEELNLEEAFRQFRYSGSFRPVGSCRVRRERSRPAPGPGSRHEAEAVLDRLTQARLVTVRKGEVFLKKLAGLEPVQTIFRHIADRDSDPFDGRRVVHDLRRLEEGQVVVLAHEPDLVADHALEHRDAGTVARGCDRIPAIGGHAEAVELARHVGAPD